MVRRFGSFPVLPGRRENRRAVLLRFRIGTASEPATGRPFGTSGRRNTPPLHRRLDLTVIRN
ncbi:MAG: hypothetical protein A4E70_01004 [Syntrophus sp. PtaU1.Bin005]|nr:MAG: hypothetical protein A4E70_01004 [Syntrophus sp. PtaU1.Bin005]